MAMTAESIQARLQARDIAPALASPDLGHRFGRLLSSLLGRRRHGWGCDEMPRFNAHHLADIGMQEYAATHPYEYPSQRAYARLW